MSEETFHQRILDHLGSAVLVFDLEKQLIFINPAGEMLFEISARQAHKIRAQHLFSQQGEKICQDLERTIKSGVTLVERYLPLNFTDRERIVHCTMTPLFKDEQVNSVVMEVEDNPHYQQLSRDEHWLTQQNAVQQLLRGLAHEIKNPLGGLRGAAQLLRAELGSRELKEYTDIIISEADRLQTLIDRLLVPHQAPQKAKLNIHQILERVRQLLEAEFPKLTFCCDYDPSLPPVLGDRDQLIQATLNIVRNAAQALKGEGEITLRTRIHRQLTIRQTFHRLVLRIDVIDQGPGIDAELKEQIFYPLVTGRAEGTGLGLSIAQSLISRHDGLIECQCESGQTVFSIYLPVESADHDTS